MMARRFRIRVANAVCLRIQARPSGNETGKHQLLPAGAGVKRVRNYSYSERGSNRCALLFYVIAIAWNELTTSSGPFSVKKLS